MENGESGASSVGGGRYELRDLHAESAGVRFWYGYDTRVRRDVAITAIPRRVSDPYTVKSRTALVQRLESPALARILDVLDEREVSYVIAERRTAGATVDPRAARAAAAGVLPLATAAEEAHRTGVTLSLDDSNRIQQDSADVSFVAFPAPASHHDPAADIRGLGGLLHRLLATVPAGDPDRAELDGLAARASTGNVATAGALVQVLERIGSGAAAPTTPMVAPAPAAPKGFLAGLDAATKRKLALGAAAVVAILLVAWLAALFIADDSDFPTKREDSVTTTAPTTTSTSPRPSTPSTPSPTPEPTTTVAPPPPTLQPTTVPPTTVLPTTVRPPTTTQAPPVTSDAPGVRPCFDGYSHQPPPDGPCLPIGNSQPVPQNPAPAPTQTPGVLPCYPGYSHQPPPNGPCLPSR